jgi:hypothetical protein
MKKTNLRNFVTGLVVGALGFALALTIPNTFTSGSPISSSAVNANFAAVKTAVDALEATITGKQARVTGTCSSNQAVQSVAADGTVTCGGSPRAWAVVYADGTVGSSSPGVTWTVTKVATGHYCIKTTPNIIATYAPVIATLHGYQGGQINVNTEYGDTCNPISNGNAVYTWNLSGVATDQYFVVTVL